MLNEDWKKGALAKSMASSGAQQEGLFWRGRIGMKTLNPQHVFLQSGFHLVLCSMFSGLLMGVFQFSLIQEDLMNLHVN